MVGSMIVIQAESLAEARKKVESDIYWTSDVVSLHLTLDGTALSFTSYKWDKERVVIMPFAQAQFSK